MLNLMTNRKGNRNLFNFDHFFSEFLPDQLIHNMDNKMMTLDIREHESSYIFDVEIPGVKKEDIDISVKDDILTITVNKTDEIHEENTTFIRRERKFGTYSRSFTIPYIDSDNILAKYDHGILRLTLPKIENQTESKKVIDIE